MNDFTLIICSWIVGGIIGGIIGPIIGIAYYECRKNRGGK